MTTLLVEGSPLDDFNKWCDDLEKARKKYLRKHPNSTPIEFYMEIKTLKDKLEEVVEENRKLKDRLERAKKISNEWTKTDGVSVWVSLEELNAMWEILNKE